MAFACAATLFTAVGLAALVCDTARAQAPARSGEETAGGTYVTPFPAGDVYKLQVYGDAFAEGLTTGLAELYAGEARVAVQRKHRPIGALVRAEWEDDVKADEANRDAVHVAVIMLGLQDRQLLRPAQAARPPAIGSEEWRQEYARRFDRVITALKKRNIAVYVVGQPVLRQPNANSQAEMLSEVMRQRASANGVRFVDIAETFQDDGGFSQFLPDLTGNRVKMRDGDGVTFTLQGYRHLAHFVQREVRRDIDQAVNDRAIPLAGDETEQRRVNPAKVAAASGVASPAGWKGAVTVGQPKAGVASQVPVAPTGDASGDQKVDNTKVTVRLAAANGREETVTLDILRPAIPAAVIALVTRREGGGDRPQQPGEPVVEEIGGGLTVVNSVSSLGDATGAAGRRRQAPAQTAFQTVLMKGDRLPPKPGRADDFAWPRNDAALPEAPRTPPATDAVVRPQVQPGAGAPNNVPRTPAATNPPRSPPQR